MRNIPLKKNFPSEKIKNLKDSGLSNEDIIKALKPNYSNQDIDDALNKQNLEEEDVLSGLEQFEPITKEKAEEPEELLEEAPEPGAKLFKESYSYEQPAELTRDVSSDQIQEIVETVIQEKWDDLLSKMGDLNLWKENVNNDLEAIKQELLRTQERFNTLQAALIGKVTDYSKSISDMSAEMKALEQVLKNILEPLSSNIRELKSVTSQLKKRKK
ncbi:MAG: hypothetical protein AABX55_02050 [Nanoarchaeota archaeon]